ncbi:MAG: SHOCT domain-containing protein [Geodermatophilaceae bacterium]|nr:SHOCT domain-containing protein [Geodermatophilaceae bacterium]MDQ3454810.1 SHOCT domain-containing protein [Actinomycetota bacterium]
MTGHYDAEPDETGVADVLAALDRVDGRTYSVVLDRHAGALSAAIDLLLDDEVVQWLFPAWIPVSGAQSQAAALVVITDRRLLVLPQPAAGIPLGWWPLDTLSSAAVGGGPTGGEQWLDVQLASTRLVLRVDRHAVAVHAAAALRRHSGAAAESPPTASPSVVDELTKWANLWQMGVLTDEEFQRKKAELLGP